MLTESNDLPFRFSRTSLVLWASYFAIIFGFCWLKAGENARDQQVQSQWQAHFKHLQKASDAEWERVSARVRTLNGKPDSQHQLELELNNGDHFDANTADSTNPYAWTDPKYGFTFAFNFRDGQIISSIGHSGTGHLLSVCPQPRRFSFDSAAESIRKSLGLICGYTWLACIGAWFVVPTRRFLWAQLSLAAALAAGMAWLVTPVYSLKLPGIFRNENLWLAALMLFVSIYLLSATVVELKARGVVLPTVRFRLRELLAAIVLVSLVLFAGPIGYVTLLVALLGGLIFAITNLVHRRWNPFQTQATSA